MGLLRDLMPASKSTDLWPGLNLVHPLTDHRDSSLSLTKDHRFSDLKLPSRDHNTSNHLVHSRDPPLQLIREDHPCLRDSSTLDHRHLPKEVVTFLVTDGEILVPTKRDKIDYDILR